MTGTVAIFFGIALVAPFVVRPLVRVLSWPVRRILPVEGRLASDAARSDPGRTAATATALLIGLALVVAVNSLGSSFLGTISDEFDRAFARDLTVQPSGLAPGTGTPADDRRPPLRAAREDPGGRGRRARAIPLHHRPARAQAARRSPTASSSDSSRPSTSRSTRPTSRGRRARRSSSGCARAR